MNDSNQTSDCSIQRDIDAYLETQWELILSDLERLIKIGSTERTDIVVPGAPFGPGPRSALSTALEIANRMGFETTDAEGFVGFADWIGKTETQIGIIGHLDVVPDGPGWTFPPYELTRKDGYLVGRGVCDDKGPVIVALHAMNFWKQRGVEFPYSLRFIFGTNEETNMKDITYFHEHFKSPSFLFTPDAEFPVCYGEKGIYQGELTWPTQKNESDNRIIMNIEGGTAINAVAGLASAELSIAALQAAGKDISALTATDMVSAQTTTEHIVLKAQGKSAHASTPEGGISAINLLVSYLLEHDACTPEERAFLQLEQRLFSATDGSGAGINTSDQDFGPLTMVGGVISTQDGCVTQSIDCRFPTTISVEEITNKIAVLAEPVGARVKQGHVKVPFLVDPNSGAIQALLSSYNQVTGEEAQPFTMGGGTYAREFPCAASFGPGKREPNKPDWAGTMHCPNEAISEALLKDAFRIYVLTIKKLMELPL